MPDVMMQLGDYQFSIATAAYRELKRTHEWRWKEVAPIGSKPRHHYLGPGQGRITIDGTIWPHYRGGLDQIAGLRAVAERGEAALLVDGLGSVWGRFISARIEQTHRAVTADGAPLRLDVRIDLTETAP